MSLKLEPGEIPQFMETFWEEQILPSLSEYIAIPNKSPDFDPDWEANGHMQTAVDHMVAWVEAQKVPGLAVRTEQLPGRTPVILLQYEGTGSNPVLIYGHLDKQPEFDGWHEGLGPWQPERRDDLLYGRGGADDGYAIYAAVAIILALQASGASIPRTTVLIEASEESGSPDLPVYMEALSAEIGTPELVIALDSTCGNYDQLWVTSSLRGMILGKLKVQVLDEGVHSGAAGGIVTSSFRALRQTLSRLEDEATGTILPSFLNDQVPASRRREAEAAGAVLADDYREMYSYQGDGQPMTTDPTELVINNTWMASMEVTGIDGVPAIKDAGNVLRPYTAAKVSLRTPPTVNASAAGAALEKLLTESAPPGATTTFEYDTAEGWHAPETAPWLQEVLDASSSKHFGAPAITMGCGGSIPFMKFLADSLPEAQFVVTGVLGPHSNAHGPNEFLHIPTAKKLSCCMVDVIATLGARDT